VPSANTCWIPVQAVIVNVVPDRHIGRVAAANTLVDCAVVEIVVPGPHGSIGL
jgi:hypothetical protein